MYENMEELKEAIKNCNRCKLCSGRKNIVFGIGDVNSKIMFIGEGPGADEDKEGIPFVGKAGKLMNNAFDAIEIEREKVYIANIVKCRPPNNRDPENDEISACINYLRNQVMIIKPKIIVLLGRIAHPAALLRDENKKIEFINDLKEVIIKYNLLNTL